MDLPKVWRPRAGLIVATSVGIGVVVAMFGMWFGLPAEERETFNGLEIITLLFFLAVLLTGLYGIAHTRLVADDTGLTVVNVYRTHRLAWAQVVRVNFRPGDPWVVLDIADGTTVSVMAMQTADGKRTRRAVRELIALVDARARPST